MTRRRKLVPYRSSKFKKKQKESILLICGGKVTEKNYFNELKRELAITSMDVEVMVSKRSTPKDICLEAKSKFEKSQTQGAPYDVIYGIFDKDDFKDFKNDIDGFNELTKTKSTNFFAIVSVPCFELWFLLHFRYTTKLYRSTHRKSAAKFLLDDLKNEWPEYEKNMENTFTKLQSKLPSAIKNAEKLSKNNAGDYSTSYTNVHVLVNKLQNLN